MVQGRAGSGNVVPLMVRVPGDLRDRIKAAAEANGRSQNSEIVATLEEKYPMTDAEVEDAFRALAERDSAIWATIKPLIQHNQTLPKGEERAANSAEIDRLIAESREVVKQILELLASSQSRKPKPRSLPDDP